MKKLLLILITAVVGFVAHAGKTIYFDKSGTDWSGVNIHWWNNSGDADDVPMTQTSGNVYVGTIPDNATNMVFQQGKNEWNNKKQTEELGNGKNVAIQANHLYYANGGTDSKQHSATDKGSVSNNTYSVYFYADDENAINVYCHIWGTDGDITTWASCPKMSDTNQYVKIGNDYHKAYSYTFITAKTPQNILFKKGAGDSDKYNDNCTFSNGKYYHAVANAGSCPPQSYTLVDKNQNPDPDPEDGYYVYFVNRNNWNNVNIWTWNNNHNHLTTATSWPGDQMELVSGNTYIWRLPAGNEVPTKVKFSNNGVNATDDLDFINHATYYPDGTVVRPFEAKNNVVYCHFKTDRMRRGNVDTPRCHVFNSVNDAKLNAWNTDVQNMERVYDPETKEDLTARYEIWQYTIPEDKVNDFNNFVFYTNTDNQWNSTEKNGSKRNDYLKTNYTKYIYATASADGGNYACPTYVTFEDFLNMHRKNVAEMGREEIFIVGPNKDEDYSHSNDFKWYDEQGGEHNFNGYDLLNCDRLTPDDGVFYLKVMPGGNSYDAANECVGNKFKLSWINVAEHRSKAERIEGSLKDNDNTNTYLDEARRWATFDLGTIGIDKDMAGDNYDENKGPAGRTKFTLNKSMRYTNYNCCDWIIWEQYGSSPRWIVLDTHNDANDPNYKCESVTITDFDPHPSLKATVYEINTNASLPSGAPSHPDFKAEKANGSVNKLANVAHANVSIAASTNHSGFDRYYEMDFNGQRVGNVKGDLNNVEYRHFPLDVTETAIKIRARYHDKNTHLNFHSRTGNSSFEGLKLDAGAPEEISVSGKYVEEKLNVEYDTNNKPTKVERTFGVFVPDFKHNFSGRYTHTPEGGKGDEGDLQAYADYEVYDENGNDITSQCKLFTGTDNETLRDRINRNFNNGYESLCWKGNESIQNWAYALNTDQNEVPLYFEKINETPVTDIKDLGERTYTILLHAVYPICYNKNFSVGDVATTSSLDGTPIAKTAADSPYVTEHVRKTTTVNLTVSPSNTVTGIDEILGDAEAENAEAEYYTISGVRVTGEPAPGIYVVRRGNKVTKEVIK